MARENLVMIEDARLAFRNFSGNEDKYNRKGDRNFCILLDESVAHQMERDGWNIKSLRGREEGDSDQPYLQVAVSYKVRPPRIVMITSRGRTVLTEDMVEMLDWVDIKMVDVTLNPYEWTVNDKGGIKAYLQTMYVTIHEDPLDVKYAEEIDGD